MRSAIFLLIALLTSALFLCAQNGDYQQDPSWNAPANAAAKTNPLASKPQAAVGGKKLFLRECAHCHGDDGRGLKKAGNLQLPAVQKQSDGTLFWRITNGNPDRGMPSFSKLPENQRWQIILHLRSMAAN